MRCCRISMSSSGRVPFSRRSFLLVRSFSFSVFHLLTVVTSCSFVRLFALPCLCSRSFSVFDDHVPPIFYPVCEMGKDERVQGGRETRRDERLEVDGSRSSRVVFLNSVSAKVFSSEFHSRSQNRVLGRRRTLVHTDFLSFFLFALSFEP